MTEPEAFEGQFSRRFFHAPATLNPCGQRLRVLVIDDDRDTADSLTTVLGLFGHEAFTAYSGWTGLGLARSLRPDVILCDLAMPGMDGFTLVEQLHDDPDLGNTTFIAASGYGTNSDLARAHLAGFHLHLLKPLDLDRLRDILAECARRRSLRQRG